MSNYTTLRWLDGPGTPLQSPSGPDTATLADGLPYSNSGVHVIRLRWFKAVSIHAMLDTVVWEAASARLVANGIAEAGAAPIED